MAVNGEGPRSRLMPEAGAGPLLCSPNTPAGGRRRAARGLDPAGSASAQTGMFLWASSKASVCSPDASVWNSAFHFS